MKKVTSFRFVVFAALAVVLVSCEAEPCRKCLEAQGNSGAGLVVDIQGLPLSLKSGIEVQTEAEAAVLTLDVAVYDDSGALEWSGHYDSPKEGRQRVTGLNAGEKTVCAVANLSLGSVPPTLNGFLAAASSLGDNAESFVMSGTVPAEASTDPVPVTLRLYRIAAKVSVEGFISTEWAGEAPSSFDITDIYLANVVERSNLAYASGAPAVNLRSSVDLARDTVLRRLTVAEKEEWTSGNLFNGGVCFYGYPNAGADRTCVMIKALYEGRVCYYPLVIDREIRRNTLYRIGDIVITSEGVENPLDDFTTVKTQFSITIADWDYNAYPEISF